MLLAVSFVSVSLFAGLLTYFQNDTAVRASEHLFRNVLAGLSDRLGELVIEYAYWDDAVTHLVGQVDADWVSSNIGRYLFDSLEIIEVHVVDGSDAVVLTLREGETVAPGSGARAGQGFAALVAAARATPDDAMPVAAVGFLRHGSDLYLAAAGRLTTYAKVDGIEVDRSTDHVIVFLQAVDGALLSRLSESYLLPDLRLGVDGDGLWSAKLPLQLSGGADGSAFVWEPDLPGSEMLPKLLAGLGAVFLLMLAMAWLFVRRGAAAAQALETARRDAQRANQAKTDFLRNVAHELRTPANAIIGFTEVMQHRMFGPLGHAKYEEYAADIHRAGGHMLALVGDLLDLERIEAGEMLLVTERLDGNRAVDEAASYVSALAGEKGVHMDLELSDLLPGVETDPRALRQVLLNLLSNAVKFTPAGGRVVCRTFRDGSGGLALQVSDSGPGLSAEQIERALQPFGQVSSGESAKYRGSGLGLPIAKRLTEALGGRFDFASRVGEGTTVTVVLPAGG